MEYVRKAMKKMNILIKTKNNTEIINKISITVIFAPFQYFSKIVSDVRFLG